MEIGNRIRNLRKEKKLTLKKLAKVSGIALATLSRIETCKMTGTVRSHQAIASALGLSLPQLYSDVETKHKPVDFQPQGSRTDIFVHNEKASFDMLTSKVLSKKMMPVMLKITLGGETSIEELPPQTEKFVYILSGTCQAVVGSNLYTLKKDETLYFDASIKHNFKNIGSEHMHAISITTPPTL